MRNPAVLEAYRQHAAERAALGIPALPLTAKQTSELIDLLKAPPAGEEAFLLDLITNRVPAGVDDAARVKAGFLAAVAKGNDALREALNKAIQEINADGTFAKINAKYFPFPIN